MADKENQLAEVKKKLKTWEYYFTKCHQRKPSKADIDGSPTDIKGIWSKVKLEDNLASSRSESYTLYAKLKSKDSSSSKCADSASNVVWGESVSIKALANSQPEVEVTANGELRTIEHAGSRSDARQENWTQRFTKRLIGRNDLQVASSRNSKISSVQAAAPPAAETDEGVVAAPPVVKRALCRKARRVPQGWRDHVQGLEGEDVHTNEMIGGQFTSGREHSATCHVKDPEGSVRGKLDIGTSLSAATANTPSRSLQMPTISTIESVALTAAATTAPNNKMCTFVTGSNMDSKSHTVTGSNMDSRSHSVTGSSVDSKSHSVTESNMDSRPNAVTGLNIYFRSNTVTETNTVTAASMIIGSRADASSDKVTRSSRVTRSNTVIGSSERTRSTVGALNKRLGASQLPTNRQDSLLDACPHPSASGQSSATSTKPVEAADMRSSDNKLPPSSQPSRSKPKSKAKVTKTSRKKGGGKVTPSSAPVKRKVGDDESSAGFGESAGQSSKKAKVMSRAPTKPRGKSSMDGNFVKLNLRKKVYSRGKTGLKGAAYKRQQWKHKMTAKRGTACFKCGEEGHWANKCTGAKPADGQETFNEATDGFLVDKPAEEYLDDIMFGAYTGSEQTTNAETDFTCNCPPLLNDDVTESDGRSQIQQTLKRVFGFDTFRTGQLETVERILRGQSTLVMLSTGAGKSLCYQLAAYMYWERNPAVAIVISPLISLMEDQVVDLPKDVRGVCLHTGQTEGARAKLMNSVLEGDVQFLLCSPEFLCSTSSANIEFFNKISSISFVCIDEAHCLSEWSHNFRPSYLRVCKVLRKRFGVKCFLGLTATATLPTVHDISGHLGLESGSADCIKGSILPPNLNLSVSKDLFKEQALLELLQSKRFSCCHSIIIYCTRREQTDRLASVIRTTLGEREATTPSTALAESYHAGLTAAQRRRVQKLFMSGKLKIVVATVAFGMGLDKSDVRAVIHYNLPKGFESYVQEIGRAGRDGLPAECHVFLEPEGTDVSELEKHTYADSVDQSSVRKLLSMIYVPCKCQMLADSVAMQEQVDVDGSVCPGHERAVVIESAISLLNISQQGIATLLFYLELHDPHWLENMSSVYSSCTIKCYGSLAELHRAAKKCIPLGVAMALSKRKSGEQQCRELTFNVLEVANLLNKPSGYIKKELRGLKWMQTPEGQYKRTGLIVEFGDLAMRAKVPGNLTESELDTILGYLKERVTLQERKELIRLNYFYHVLQKLAYKDYFMVAEEADARRSESLKKSVIDYFMSSDPTAGYQLPDRGAEQDALSYITAQVVRFVQTYSSEHDFSGRDVAKILCGIASPNFPPNVWGRVRGFWRSLLGHDFNTIVKVASEQLLRLR